MGNEDKELGFYSFHVLPVDLPGEFYVVFESPSGYRLTGGTGKHWEVGEAAEHDYYRPLMADMWGDNEGAADAKEDVAVVPNDNTTNATEAAPPAPPPAPVGPINHSGYYARSTCIAIQQSPTRISTVDAGLAAEAWPLLPRQYASLVATVRFYAAGRRRAQADGVSLECRKYQKMTSEGVDVPDVWGCSRGEEDDATIDMEALTLEEGDGVVASLRAFLESRVSRVWTIKVVALAHQELTLGRGGGARWRRLDGGPTQKDGSPRRRLPAEKHEARGLQANELVATLELGFRVSAEYSIADVREINLNEVLTTTLRGGSDSFLMELKKQSPYFERAGVVEVRDKLWQPAPEQVVKEEIAIVEDIAPTSSPSVEEDGMALEVLLGAIFGALAFVLIMIGGLGLRQQRRKAIERGDKKKVSGGAKKFWQRNKGGDAVFKTGGVGGGIPDGSDYDDDDLSSRFFSDSSQYDPATRAQEVGGYGDGGSVYSDGTDEQSHESEDSGSSYRSGSTRSSSGGSILSEDLTSYMRSVDGSQSRRSQLSGARSGGSSRVMSGSRSSGRRSRGGSQRTSGTSSTVSGLYDTSRRWSGGSQGSSRGSHSEYSSQSGSRSQGSHSEKSAGSRGSHSEYSSQSGSRNQGSYSEQSAGSRGSASGMYRTSQRGSDSSQRLSGGSQESQSDGSQGHYSGYSSQSGSRSRGSYSEQSPGSRGSYSMYSEGSQSSGSQNHSRNSRGSYSEYSKEKYSASVPSARSRSTRDSRSGTSSRLS